MTRACLNLTKVVSAFLAVWGALLFSATDCFALSQDQTSLVVLANYVVTNGQSGSNQAYVTGMAINGPWALVDWSDRVNTGGELLASKSNGKWSIVRSTGGQWSATELTTYGIDLTTATWLRANLRPLPPLGGTSHAANGTSTHTETLEKCPTGNDPPGPYFYDATIDTTETVIIYSTSSIAPTSPEAAVVLDVTPTSGSALVKLYDPTGTLLQTATVQVGLTGGVGYWSPIATTGIYTARVSGTFAGNGQSDCGRVLSGPNTYTDAAWASVLSW